MTRIEKMREDGYPKIIKGNGGYRAYSNYLQHKNYISPIIKACYR